MDHVLQHHSQMLKNCVWARCSLLVGGYPIPISLKSRKRQEYFANLRFVYGFCEHTSLTFGYTVL